MYKNVVGCTISNLSNLRAGVHPRSKFPGNLCNNEVVKFLNQISVSVATSVSLCLVILQTAITTSQRFPRFLLQIGLFSSIKKNPRF